jgi:hypothetical protein
VRHEDDIRDLVDKTVKRFGALNVAINSRHQRPARRVDRADRRQLRRYLRYQCARHAA